MIINTLPFSRFRLIMHFYVVSKMSVLHNERLNCLIGLRQALSRDKKDAVTAKNN